MNCASVKGANVLIPESPNTSPVLYPLPPSIILTPVNCPVGFTDTRAVAPSPVPPVSFAPKNEPTTPVPYPPPVPVIDTLVILLNE